MTQIHLRGHDFGSVAAPICSLDIGLERFLLDVFVWRSSSSGGDLDSGEALPKSEADPVFGVLAAEPKAANAPDPRPKAEDATGDVTALLVVNDGSPLALLE